MVESIDVSSIFFLALLLAPTHVSTQGFNDIYEGIGSFNVTCALPVIEKEAWGIPPDKIDKLVSRDPHSFFRPYIDLYWMNSRFLCGLSRVTRQALCRKDERICNLSNDLSCPECRDDAGFVDEACRKVPPGDFCLVVPGNLLNQKGKCVFRRVENAGDPFHRSCPLGWYCEGQSADPKPCPKGSYCPSGSANISACPDGHMCPLALAALPCNTSSGSFISGVECKPSKHRNFKTIFPKPCKAGYYCPNGERIECPQGSYCPEGSSTPLKCDTSLRHICPAGSRRPGHALYATLRTTVVLIFFAVLIFTVHTWALKANLRPIRILALVGVLAWVLGYELTRERPLYSPCAFLAFQVFNICWVEGAGEQLYRVGPNVEYIVNFTVAVVAPILMGFIAGDTFAGLFMAVALPSVYFLRYVLVDSESTAGQKLRRLWILLVAALSGCGLHSMHSTLFFGCLTMVFLFRPLLMVWRYSYTQRTSQPYSVGDSVGAMVQSQRGSLVSNAPRTSLELTATFQTARSSKARRDTCHTTRTGTTDEESVDTREVGISIEFENVSLLLPNGQVILNDLSLLFPAASSVAIMGPSGCGKSSITNVLSGRSGYGTVQGKISINGKYGKDVQVHNLREVIGFVPQDDVMHRMLSVRENVMFQAELRMPWGDTRDRTERSQRVEKEVGDVLRSFGLARPELQASCIGDETKRGISGGQRKRVSIAMEYVGKPSLLFLDEPTSGLDSSTSFSVVEAITSVAKTARCTTFAVIHQPRYEMLTLFDRLVLLATGGHLVYSGAASEAKTYFSDVLGITFPSSANPADIMMDAIAFDSGLQMMKDGRMKPLVPNDVAIDEIDYQQFGLLLAREWNQFGVKYSAVSRSLMDVPLPPLNIQTCTWANEMWIQTKRALLQLHIGWKDLVFNNLLLAVGLLLCCLVAKDTTATKLLLPAVAFFVMMLTQGVAANRIFGGVERYVAWREAGTRIRPLLYFVGRDMAANIEIAVPAIIFTCLFSPLGTLQIPSHMLFWAGYAFTYCVYGLSFIFSILFDPNTAQLLSVVSCAVAYIGAGCGTPSFQDLCTTEVGLHMMMFSPLRLAYGFAMHQHLHGEGTSGLRNPFFMKTFGGPMMSSLGFAAGSSASDCDDFTCSMRIRQRWVGIPETDQPPVGNVCSLTQLFLLGVLFRCAASLSLILICKIQASGGGGIMTVAGVVDNDDELNWDTITVTLVGRVWLLFLIISFFLMTQILWLTL